MVEYIYTKPFLVHAVGEEVFVHYIDADGTMNGLPSQPMLPIGQLRFVFVAARHDDEPRVKVERTPFERASEDNSAVFGFQGDAGAGIRGVYEQ